MSEFGNSGILSFLISLEPMLYKTTAPSTPTRSTPFLEKCKGLPIPNKSPTTSCFGPRILNPVFTHHPYIKVFLCHSHSILLINNKCKAIIEHKKNFVPLHTWNRGTLVFETPHLATSLFETPQDSCQRIELYPYHNSAQGRLCGRCQRNRAND